MFEYGYIFWKHLSRTHDALTPEHKEKIRRNPSLPSLSRISGTQSSSNFQRIRGEENKKRCFQKSSMWTHFWENHFSGTSQLTTNWLCPMTISWCVFSSWSKSEVNTGLGHLGKWKYVSSCETLRQLTSSFMLSVGQSIKLATSCAQDWKSHVWD